LGGGKLALNLVASEVVKMEMLDLVVVVVVV
jgi:hypothetical protein